MGHPTRPRVHGEFYRGYIDPALVWPPLLYTHREGLNKILQSSAETGRPIDPMIKKSTVPPFTSDL